MNGCIKRSLNAAIILWLVAAVFGCRSIYYDTMAKFGYQKRDLLVKSIQKALETQKDTKEQLQTTLEKFSALTGFSGGDLEDTYNKLKSELEDSQKEAQRLKDHISDVEEVAGDMFDEWESELSEYHDRELRSKSRAALQKTKSRYRTLITSMKKVEKKIDPVLIPLEDRVLFLKHNLNAKAIASLDQDLKSIKTDASSLIEAIQSSTDEANSFLDEMDKQEKGE